MKKILISIFILSSFFLSPATKAFGECSQYGTMVIYNPYSNTCQCMSGYVLGSDMFGNQSCVRADSICHNQLGFNSQYNDLENRCECKSQYVLREKNYGSGLECVTCTTKHGFNSSYNWSTKSCECNDGYTLGKDGTCIKQNNSAYYFMKEVKSGSNEIIVCSKYNNQCFRIVYSNSVGCSSSAVEKYAGRDVVINLGKDFNIDSGLNSDYLFLQDHNVSCNIWSVNKVSNNYSLQDKVSNSEKGSTITVKSEYNEITPTKHYNNLTDPEFISTGEIIETTILKFYGNTFEDLADAFADPNAPSFRDVSPSHRYFKALEIAKGLGIFNGYNGLAGPDYALNRAATIETIISAGDVELLIDPQLAIFSDVSVTDWYNKTGLPALTHCIIKNENNLFFPNQAVTRTTFNTWLNNTAKIANGGKLCSDKINDSIPKPSKSRPSDSEFISTGEIIDATIRKFYGNTFEDLADAFADSNAPSFRDVPPSHRYFKALEIAKGLDIFKGYTDRTARPDSVLGRAPAIQILLSTSDLELLIDVPLTSFSDISIGELGSEEVLVALTYCIIQNENNLFHPDQTVTRTTFNIWLNNTAKIASGGKLCSDPTKGSTPTSSKEDNKPNIPSVTSSIETENSTKKSNDENPKEKTNETLHQFSDISEHWGASFIDTLAQKKMVNGKTGRFFAPDDPASRAELIKLIVETKFPKESIDSCLGMFPDDSETIVFPDVRKNDWFSKYVCLAYTKGITKGRGNGTFAPNEPVTRAEAVKLLLLANGVQPKKENENSFEDVPEGEWFTDFVIFAINNNIVEGTEKNGKRFFSPHQPLSRAEMAKLVVKILMDTEA
jgi:hypothetical protein